MLGIRFEPKKNQKFDIGRTINPFLCDCKDCDFLRCPKKNYCVEMSKVYPTVSEYIEMFSDDLIKWQFLTDDLLMDFMECFRFPKGLYWNTNYDKTLVELIGFNRSGSEVFKGSVNLRTGAIVDYDLSQAGQRLAERLSKGVKQIFQFIEEKKG